MRYISRLGTAIHSDPTTQFRHQGNFHQIFKLHFHFQTLNYYQILVNDIHWMLNDATIKDELKKNQTVVAIREVQILEILPKIIKTKLYEDSSLMVSNIAD